MAFIMIDKEGKMYQWTVDKPKPKFDIRATERIIDILQVTGKELNFIRLNFLNTPSIGWKHNTCTWRGDMAQFIYDNL